jgi:hypothetical protein
MDQPPQANSRYDLGRARKIQVKDGRLVLDEPTDLLDGAEVEVLLIDDELAARRAGAAARVARSRAGGFRRWPQDGRVEVLAAV